MATVCQVALADRGIDLRDGVEERQWRHRFKLADAEVAAHRGDGGKLRTCCRQAPDQPREDDRLLLRGIVREVPGHFAHIGVRDRQVEDGATTGVAFDQTAVVVLGCGWTDAADKSDVHGNTLAV